VLTPTTPNLTAAFKALIEVGGNGAGTESVLLPALWALTAPRITDENAGFVRDDASLAVIGFTSAPDQALRPAGYFIDALLNLKGPQLFSLAILGPTQPAAPSGCPGGYDDWSGSDALVEAVVEGTRGLRTEYCTTNWPATLDLLGNAAASPLRTLYLRAPRDVAKPMQVKLNGVVLPAFDARGPLWTYDPLTSALELQPLYAPGVGDTVSVTFSAQCL
jgi:hypothetical protein